MKESFSTIDRYLLWEQCNYTKHFQMQNIILFSHWILRIARIPRIHRILRILTIGSIYFSIILLWWLQWYCFQIKWIEKIILSISNICYITVTSIIDKLKVLCICLMYDQWWCAMVADTSFKLIINHAIVCAR